MIMTLFDPGPDILDVTLRDGSYLIDFQFTDEDTGKIAAGLEAVGIRWIEVGHGLGLNASAAGKGNAAASDEAYLAAAQSMLQSARWGMFCLPGIARLQDLKLASRYNMSFVRVGADISEMETGRSYIEKAKELGMIVSYNAMKSYAASPREFGACAARAGEWGADIICLVDSAGGMFPKDVAAYLEAAKGETDVFLGYHGHDNLTLSMANTLQAVECGAVLVDASLQGMGRSAGNTATEPLAAILKQRGYLERVDINALMDVGQGFIAPMMHRQGLDPMAITAGYSLFHSSFTAKVRQYADKYGLDIRDLIVGLTREAIVDAPDHLLERLGKDLAAARIPRVISIPAFVGARVYPDDPLERLKALVEDLRPKAVKAKKFSALNIVTGEVPMAEMVVSGNIQETPAHMVGSITLTGREKLTEALEVADGRVDLIFLDVDRKLFGARSPAQIARSVLKTSLLLTYLDSRVWISAVEDQGVRLLGESIENRVSVIIGNHPKSRFLALRLAERLSEVILLGEDDGGFTFKGKKTLSMAPLALKMRAMPMKDPQAAMWIGKADMIVAWTRPMHSLGPKVIRSVAKGALVLDAGMGSLNTEAVVEAQQKGVNLVRLNMWPALAGALAAAHESDRVRREDLGYSEMNGIPVVAGGAIGKAGDVVVDSITYPSRVIGLADGCGGFLSLMDDHAKERVLRVKEEINRVQVAPRV